MTIPIEEADFFQFKKPIRSVAVIGGGPSGTTALKHLVDQGFHVRLFEIQSATGGIWTWNPETPLPSSADAKPSTAHFTPKVVQRSSSDALVEPVVRITKDPKKEAQKEFNPPNPVYWNLVNNVPTPAMQFKDFPWPQDTDWYLTHDRFAKYVQDYAEHFNLNQHASYNTRVENVKNLETDDKKWRLTLRKLEVLDQESQEIQETFWTEDFDAIVVATGHYGAPFIPVIEGESEWAKRFPESVIHSRAYRRPETYKDKTVLLIGTGTSGVDIGHDLGPLAKKIYQITRDKIVGPEDYQQFRNKQKTLLPQNGEVLPEIKRFLPLDGIDEISKGKIELSNGRILTDVDAVIFSTGFQYSFPFLPDFHHDLGTVSTSKYQAPSNVLVTNGAGIWNVYRDSFYIPDPTLTFIGLSINTPTFSFFEFQSIAIARVFAGLARLPGLSARKKEYEDRLVERGGLKWVHLIGQNHPKYVNETVEWINREAVVFDAKPITGYSKEQLSVGDKTLDLVWRKYQFGTKAANDYVRQLLRNEKQAASIISGEEVATPLALTA